MDLMKMQPKWYRCPFCSRKHRLNEGENFGYYNSKLNPMLLDCEFSERHCYKGNVVSLYFDELGCHYLVNIGCLAERGIIPKKSFIQSVTVTDGIFGFRLPLHKKKVQCYDIPNLCRFRQDGPMPIVFGLKPLEEDYVHDSKQLRL